jgi:hypothetical protein
VEPLRLKSFSRQYSAEFPANLSQTSFDIGQASEVFNCSASIGGVGGGLEGNAWFENACEGEDAGEAKLLLVDVTMSEIAGAPVVEDGMDVDAGPPGLRQNVSFRFGRRYPYHDYAIGLSKKECIRASVEHERGYGVEPYYVFCGEYADPREANGRA